MSSTLVDAKALCNDQILDVLNHPMFTIFQIQHDQIADRVDSDNKLLYHFKQSMSKMSQWNSSVVHDFCTKLVKKFPALRTCEVLSSEMIKLTCRIMNEAHESEGRYVAVEFAFHDVLHSFIVECSKVFIEHPEWFSHGADSTEYQTCLNNARIAMKNREVVYNATRKYVTLTNLPASPSASSSSSSPSSSSPSSPSSPSLNTFGKHEPISGSGLYLTNGNDSGSGAGGDDSGDETNDQQPITKNINVVTGDVETVPFPTPTPTFQESMVNHLSQGNILHPGPTPGVFPNGSSVYPNAPNVFNNMPPPNHFGPCPANVFGEAQSGLNYSAQGSGEKSDLDDSDMVDFMLDPVDDEDMSEEKHKSDDDIENI